MGKRHVDHDTALDTTPITKKRKTDTCQLANNTQYAGCDADTQPIIPVESNGDVTYSLTTDIVDGVILTDLCAKKWRCGKPIGKKKK